MITAFEILDHLTSLYDLALKEGELSSALKIKHLQFQILASLSQRDKGKIKPLSLWSDAELTEMSESLKLENRKD